MNLIFKKVFNLLPERYYAKAVIAGGAAVDLDKAGDIDVFVLGINDDTKRDDLIDELHRQHIAGIVFRATKLAGEFAAQEFTKDSNDSGSRDDFDVIADVHGGMLGINIQIIASPFLNPTDLLQDFDISTHAVAIDITGNTLTIPETTSTATSPKVLNGMRTPDLTLARYRKVCLRYNLYPDADELIRLVLMPDKQPVPVTTVAEEPEEILGESF